MGHVRCWVPEGGRGASIEAGETSRGPAPCSSRSSAAIDADRLRDTPRTGTPFEPREARAASAMLEDGLWQYDPDRVAARKKPGVEDKDAKRGKAAHN